MTNLLAYKKIKFRHIKRAAFLAILVLAASAMPVLAGDVFYGKVTEIRNSEVIVVDYGKGQYIVRIIGIVTPKDGPVADKAKEFVSRLAGQEVRARFEGRNKEGEMVCRVFFGTPGIDVGLEMVRTGLARRQSDYDYKYGELSAAEREARSKKLGVWGGS